MKYLTDDEFTDEQRVTQVARLLLPMGAGHTWVVMRKADGRAVGFEFSFEDDGRTYVLQWLDKPDGEHLALARIDLEDST